MWEASYKTPVYLFHFFHLHTKKQLFARRSTDIECCHHGSYCKWHCSGLHYYEGWLHIPGHILITAQALKYRPWIGVNSWHYFEIIWFAEKCTWFFLFEIFIKIMFHFIISVVLIKSMWQIFCLHLSLLHGFLSF